MPVICMACRPSVMCTVQRAESQVHQQLPSIRHALHAKLSLD